MALTLEGGNLAIVSNKPVRCPMLIMSASAASFMISMVLSTNCSAFDFSTAVATAMTSSPVRSAGPTADHT